jgi:hypothetical protein
MTRTLEDELRALLRGHTIEEVRVEERTGKPVALLRLSYPGAEDAYVGFDAGSFSDAKGMWDALP